MSGGHLIACADCRSMFRHPVLQASDYMLLYERGVADQWDGISGREDLRVIGDILRAEGRPLRLLDIGCGAGEFLRNMPGNMEKYGIEPSPAAQQAAARGVTILGPDVAHMPVSLKFDAIMMIDVIEHVVDPASLLFKAYEHLLPGGMIIVSSGNPECGAWREIFKSRFWYVSFPEHITFPSGLFFEKWCDTHRAVAGPRVVSRYMYFGALPKLTKLLMQLVFFLSPSTFNLAGRFAAWFNASPGPRRKRFSPGIPGLFIDHHVCIVRRPDSASPK